MPLDFIIILWVGRTIIGIKVNYAAISLFHSAGDWTKGCKFVFPFPSGRTQKTIIYSAHLVQ